MLARSIRGSALRLPSTRSARLWRTWLRKPSSSLCARCPTPVHCVPPHAAVQVRPPLLGQCYAELMRIEREGGVLLHLEATLLLLLQHG